MRRPKAVHILIVGCTLLLWACSPQSPNIAGSPGGLLRPAATQVPKAASNNMGWQRVDNALEFRRMQLGSGQQSGEVNILRLEPSAYHIRVAYDAARPGRISEWAAAVKPVALINGGYFDVSKRATALVIFDGIVRGTSYEGFGGMVVVNGDGNFELRSLRQQPYDPAEPLQQAMQSAPMLIQPGGTVSELDVDENRSRRTVIARDTSGRILLLVCDWPAFTLKELATLLKESDLELDAALNLDGGRSTGMYLQTSAMQLLIDSFDSVPLVLVVDRK